MVLYGLKNCKLLYATVARVCNSDAQTLRLSRFALWGERIMTVTKQKIPSICQAAGVLLVLCGGAVAQFTPTPSGAIFVGTSPVSVVVGNFDGDALPDIAIANQMDGTVRVILGKNLFQTPPATSSFPVGTNPSSIAIGDFDKDGNQDLAVTNQTDNTITVLFGDGAGGFSRNTLIKIPGLNSPSFLAVGDFNNDSDPDLVVVNRAGNNVTVLLGLGNGQFIADPKGPFPVGNSPSCVAVGDFNGDGNRDLAITNELDNTVTVLLGDGKGGFTPATVSPFLVGYGPSFVVTADFNLDGNLDLAVANLSANNVTLLLGNGAGNFTAAPSSPFNVGAAPVSMAVADFNGDGYADLAVANSAGGNVTVLLGNGTGGFKPATGSPYTAGKGPASVAVGDFNQNVREGQLGLVVANKAEGSITVLLNTFTYTPTMVSAAGYTAATPVAPGSIVTIFGTDPVTAGISAPGIPLPGCLGGVSVTITDSSGVKSFPLPLFYVGPGQINAQVPQTAATGAATFSIATSPSADCTSAPAGVAQKGTVTLAPVAPGLFSANATGKGVAAADFIQNVALNTSPVPAYTCPPPSPVQPCYPVALDVSSGASALVLYGTGIRNRSSLSAVTVTIAGQALSPFYAGPVPNMIGLDQVNVSLPSSLAHSGTAFVTVTAAGVVSNQVTLYFP